MPFTGFLSLFFKFRIIFFCRFYFLEVLLYAFHVPILPLFRFGGKIDFRAGHSLPVAFPAGM